MVREVIYKTRKAFLWELAGELGELQCDNQDVVKMLQHPTSRSPKLVQLIQQLWLLLYERTMEAPSQVHPQRGPTSAFSWRLG